MDSYAERINNDVIRLVNTTGATINQNELVVLGNFVAISEEDVVAGATGPFYVQEGMQVQLSDLVPGENTFGTQGQEVYYDPATDKASDTLTAGYYAIGKLSKVKDSGGVIVVDKYRYADLVTSEET